MPVFGALSVWVVTPKGVPFVALDPVIVTEMLVAAWLTEAPPLLIVVELVPTAIVPVGLETLKEKVPEFGLFLESPL